MSRSIRSVVVFGVVALLCGLAPSARAALFTGNKFVTARVFEADGKVTISTTDGGYYGGLKFLTFDNTSYLTADIAGQIYTNNSLANGPNIGPLDSRFGGYLNNGYSIKIADTISTTWKLPAGDLIQEVYPVAFDYSGQIIMRWKYHSRSYDPQRVQVQFLLDTRIVANDKARILTRYGYTNTWAQYAKGGNVNFPDVPSFFQAFEHDLSAQYQFKPGVVSQGTLISADLGLIKPDAVLIGAWPEMSAILWGGWSGTFPPGPYGDSAILFTFGAAYLNALQTSVVGSTAYGTGEFETCTGDLYGLIFRPRTIRGNTGGTDYKPNPFTVDLYLFNTSDYTEASNARATMTVGNHLTIIDSSGNAIGQTQTVKPVPSTVHVGSVSTYSWMVKAERTCDTVPSYLMFKASSSLGPDGFTDTCKLLVALPCLDRDTIPPFAYPLVNNGFAKSIAFDDAQIRDKGIDRVENDPYDTKAFLISIDPFSHCTKEKVWVNITQLDSTIGGCIHLRVYDCAGNMRPADICFPKYPLHPDTIPPRIFLVAQRGSFDGSLCNMKFDSLLATDDTTYDKGLTSITLTPGVPPVNMVPTIPAFPKGSASQRFSVHVIDSMVDGSISIRATDGKDNFTDYTLSYCTIADANRPINTIFRTGPYKWSIASEDNKPWDRGIDTIEVYNRQNIQLVNGGIPYEPNRTDTRRKASYAFNIEVIDTSKIASFCLRTKDLADSLSLAITAHWWSGDTCVTYDTVADVWYPNIGLNPPPQGSPVVVHVNVNDIHYYNATNKIGWDHGIDSVWFTNVHGMTVPPAFGGGCQFTVPTFDVRVTDPYALDSLSTVCIHVRDCAGNETDTCWYYPIKPDADPPIITGLSGARTQLNLRVADSTLLDRGLRHIILTNSDNFQPYEVWETGDPAVTTPILVDNKGKSSIGTLEAADMWGSKSTNPLDLFFHTTKVNVAIWVQDIRFKAVSFADQNNDITIPVEFTKNDTFSVDRKKLTEFQFAFDLVGNSGMNDFTFVGVDTKNTASANFNVNASQTGSRVTVHGVSKDGSILSGLDSVLLNVVIHCPKEDTIRQLTISAVDQNGASIIYNGDKLDTIVPGARAMAILPAPYGSVVGGAILSKGFCNPGMTNDPATAPKAVSLYHGYPNPFSRTTDMDYTVAATGYVTLIVYDALGNEITRLVNTTMEPGSYTATFNGATLPSGTYYARLEAGGKIISRKLELQR